MQVLQFDYFRGMEAEQYSFYRVPKVLFTAECFKPLSCEAKVLYGLMLDRMGLSIKNRWFDEEDRVYIIFTVEETMELLGCSRQKAVKSLSELDTEKGIGLIEKKRLGLGKPNVIYVKNFMIKDCPEYEEQPGNAETAQKYENHTSGSMKNKLQEVPKTYFKKCENHTSGNMKNELQEVPKSNSIKTDIIKTDSSETDLNETDRNNGRVIPSNPILSKPSVWDGQDAIAQREAYDTAKKLTGIIEQTGVIALEVSDEHLEDVLSAVQKIADENGKIEVNTIKQTISSIQKYYDPSIKTFYMISAILFVFGAISLMNMLMVDFQNRKREFGLLEAVGTTQNQLKGMVNRELGIYLSGSLIISLLGGGFLSVIVCGQLDAVNHSITLKLPWIFLLILIAVLMVIYFVFSIYAKSELKKTTILSAIRDE